MNTEYETKFPILFLPGCIGKYTKQEMKAFAEESAKKTIDFHFRSHRAKKQYERIIDTGMSESDPISKLHLFLCCALTPEDYKDMKDLLVEVLYERTKLLVNQKKKT